MAESHEKTDAKSTTIGGMWYSGMAHKIQQASPALFGLLRFIRRATAQVLRQPLLLLALAVISGIMAWVLIDARFDAHQDWITGGLVASLLAAAIGYVANKAQLHIQKLHDEFNQMNTEATRVRKDLAIARTQLERVSNAPPLKSIENMIKTSLLTHVSASETRQEQNTEALKAKLVKVWNSQQERSSQLQTLSESLQERCDHLKILSESLQERITELESLQQASNDKQIALNQELTSANEHVSMLSSKVDNYDERISETEKWSTHNNAKWFQTFNRRFTNHHAFALERDDWRKRLSIPMSRPLLGYMADRACRIERELEGRLATSVEDMVLRALVAKAVKGSTISVLEIGTLFGTGAAIIYDSVRGHYEDVHFTLLDPLEGYYHGNQSDILTGQIVDETAVRRNLAKVGMDESEFTLIKHLSIEPEAMEAAALRQYDVLVIDGDHSYAGVKTDFENYAKYVKVGGYIIFDDYSSPDWPDVQAYVDAEIGNVDFVAPVGSSWRTCVFRVVKAPVTSRAKKQPARPRATPKASKKPATTDADTVSDE